MKFFTATLAFISGAIAVNTSSLSTFKGPSTGSEPDLDAEPSTPESGTEPIFE